VGGIAMLKQFNTRLRDKAVITAAILSVFGHDVAAADPLKFGGSNNDNNTTSPIKHVIVIVGENRTFDHLFATYVPKQGQTVSNLLSKGIIDISGKPAANYLSSSNTRLPHQAAYSKTASVPD
jgi:phospholipase C